MDRKFLGGILGTVILVILIWLAVVWLNQNNLNSGLSNEAGNNQNTDPATEEQVTLTSTAKTYVSDPLGVRFTYESKPTEAFEVMVTEKDNKIYLHGTTEQPEQGKIIEVFNKDQNLTLRQAIEQRFLQNINSNDCFVVEIPQSVDDPRPDNYVFAEISYPEPTEEGAPFWQNAEKCPQAYAKTNAVQFFMMNPAVPNKFVFMVLGQDSITSDGVIREGDNRYDWSASMRIIK